MRMVRAATHSDFTAIDRLLRAAFEGADEADLVRQLRTDEAMTVELVAEDATGVIGHIAFSPVTATGARGVGLAPLAVAPERQGQGIGSMLVRAGLEACALAGEPFAVVLGHPGYYERLGFARAREFGITNPFGLDDEFLVVALRPGGLPAPGLVRYAQAFRRWETAGEGA
jgi:putative acetyltransferase